MTVLDPVENPSASALRTLQGRQATLRAEVSAAFTKADPLQRILQQCADAVIRQLQIPFAHIWTYEPKKDDWLLQASARQGSVEEDLSSWTLMEQLHIEEIAQSRLPFLTNDLEGDAPMSDREWIAREGISALAGYPLIVEQQAVGVMTLFGRTMFTDDTLNLLASITDILAQGITRKLAEERLQQAKATLEQQNNRLEALYRVGQMINSTLKPKEILDHLTDEAMRVTRASHGQVLVVNEEVGVFERRSLRGFSEEESERARTKPLPLNQGINGIAYRTHQPVRSDDVQAAPDYFPLIDGTRTELVVPIVRMGRVLGNLDLQSPEVGAFRDVDLNYLNALADQVAIALENARVFNKMAQAKRDWEVTFNAMHDAVALIDHDLRIVHGNQSFVELTEGVAPQAAGHLFMSLIDPKQHLSLVDQVEHTTLTGEIGRSVQPFKGRTYDVQTLPVWRGDLGSLDHMARTIFVMRDITERKRAEEELKALAARLEQSNRELQDFASVASHDLQEPLRKIQAFGDRLRAKHGERLGPEGDDYLERMQNAASRMQTLINDLLTYSRVTTKAKPFTPVDLALVVQEVLFDLEVRIEGEAAKVHVGELPTIEAEPFQMRQLFQNLIGNALKYHRPDVSPIVQVHGQITDQPDTLPEESEAGPWCQLIVADNGIGFDEKYLDRIFTPFQRLHSRSEYEGTGMGLAVCRKIVERHGGFLTARSRPGEGATFIATLPVRQPRPSSGTGD